jgi:aryl-alcohol dehydrogenase-like predicted oxidoreductase
MNLAALKLGLGCALFGARSGPVASRAFHARTGVDAAEAFATIALAAEAGVTLADTSAQWGDSESVLGQVLPSQPPFSIITKTAPIAGGVEAVERRARASLDHLGQSRARGLVVHDAADLLGPDGPALWTRLRRLKDEGLFEAIGFSACACDDPVGLARRFQPDIVQVPLSLLDQRLIVSGALAELAATGVEVHLRSIFVQGLMFLPGHDLPVEARDLAPGLSRLRRLVAEAGADPLRIALGFALSRPEAARVIVGVSSPRELRAILAAAVGAPPELDWAAFRAATPCPQARPVCAAA